MDKRKLEHYARVELEMSEEIRVHELVNSSRVNDALLNNAENMFDLEYLLR